MSAITNQEWEEMTLAQQLNEIWSNSGLTTDEMVEEMQARCEDPAVKESHGLLSFTFTFHDGSKIEILRTKNRVKDLWLSARMIKPNEIS